MKIQIWTKLMRQVMALSSLTPRSPLSLIVFTTRCCSHLKSAFKQASGYVRAELYHHFTHERAD